jgi:hypothetical protein
MLPLYACRKVVNGWTCAVEIRNDISGELGSLRSSRRGYKIIP